MKDGTRAISRVSDVLNAQRHALLSGDLSGLERLAVDLETAFSALAATQPAPDQLKPLKRRAAQNAELLNAARRGLARASETLRPTVQPRLTTYDQSGRQSPAQPGAGKLLARR